MEKRRRSKSVPGNYLKRGPSSPSSSTSSSSSSSTSSKHRQTVVSWLQSKFSIKGSGSLSKQSVYEDYINMCKENNLESTTAAVFGKFLHKAFPTVKTTRKGPRGATRHHYKFLSKREDVESISAPSTPTKSGQGGAPLLLEAQQVDPLKRDKRSGTFSAGNSPLLLLEGPPAYLPKGAGGGGGGTEGTGDAIDIDPKSPQQEMQAASPAPLTPLSSSPISGSMSSSAPSTPGQQGTYQEQQPSMGVQQGFDEHKLHQQLLKLQEEQLGVPMSVPSSPLRLSASGSTLSSMLTPPQTMNVSAERHSSKEQQTKAVAKKMKQDKLPDRMEDVIIVGQSTVSSTTSPSTMTQQQPSSASSSTAPKELGTSTPRGLSTKEQQRHHLRNMQQHMQQWQYAQHPKKTAASSTPSGGGGTQSKLSPLPQFHQQQPRQQLSSSSVAPPPLNPIQGTYLYSSKRPLLSAGRARSAVDVRGRTIIPAIQVGYTSAGGTTSATTITSSSQTAAPPHSPLTSTRTAAQQQQQQQHHQQQPQSQLASTIPPGRQAFSIPYSQVVSQQQHQRSTHLAVATTTGTQVWPLAREEATGGEGEQQTIYDTREETQVPRVRRKRQGRRSLSLGDISAPLPSEGSMDNTQQQHEQQQQQQPQLQATRGLFLDTIMEEESEGMEDEPVVSSSRYFGPTSTVSTHMYHHDLTTSPSTNPPWVTMMTIEGGGRHEEPPLVGGEGQTEDSSMLALPSPIFRWDEEEAEEAEPSTTSRPSVYGSAFTIPPPPPPTSSTAVGSSRVQGKEQERKMRYQNKRDGKKKSRETTSERAIGGRYQQQQQMGGSSTNRDVSMLEMDYFTELFNRSTMLAPLAINTEEEEEEDKGEEGEAECEDDGDDEDDETGSTEEEEESERPTHRRAGRTTRSGHASRNRKARDVYRQQHSQPQRHPHQLQQHHRHHQHQQHHHYTYPGPSPSTHHSTRIPTHHIPVPMASSQSASSSLRQSSAAHVSSSLPSSHSQPMLMQQQPSRTRLSTYPVTPSPKQEHNTSSQLQQPPLMQPPPQHHVHQHKQLLPSPMFSIPQPMYHPHTTQHPYAAPSRLHPKPEQQSSTSSSSSSSSASHPARRPLHRLFLSGLGGSTSSTGTTSSTHPAPYLLRSASSLPSSPHGLLYSPKTPGPASAPTSARTASSSPLTISPRTILFAPSFGEDFAAQLGSSPLQPQSSSGSSPSSISNSPIILSTSMGGEPSTLSTTTSGGLSTQSSTVQSHSTQLPSGHEPSVSPTIDMIEAVLTEQGSLLDSGDDIVVSDHHQPPTSLAQSSTSTTMTTTNPPTTASSSSSTSSLLQWLTPSAITAQCPLIPNFTFEESLICVTQTFSVAFFEYHYKLFWQELFERLLRMDIEGVGELFFNFWMSVTELSYLFRDPSFIDQCVMIDQGIYQALFGLLLENRSQIEGQQWAQYLLKVAKCLKRDCLMQWLPLMESPDFVQKKDVVMKEFCGSLKKQAKYMLKKGGAASSSTDKK